eukprot:4139629-Prymnesium_polylepis.1
MLPVGLKKPGSVSVHSSALVRFFALEYVPSLHGSAADAPALQYEPGSHASHAVAPSASWYVPGAHCKQTPSPAVGATVPAAQLTAVTLPEGLKKPGAVEAHSAALRRRCTRLAIRARLARLARRRSLGVLVLACVASQARPESARRCDGACSATSRHNASRGAEEAGRCRGTLGGAREGGRARVRALAARQRRRCTRLAVQAAQADFARRRPLRVLKPPRGARLAFGEPCRRRDRTNRAHGRCDAGRRAVEAGRRRCALGGARE